MALLKILPLDKPEKVQRAPDNPELGAELDQFLWNHGIEPLNDFHYDPFESIPVSDAVVTDHAGSQPDADE